MPGACAVVGGLLYALGYVGWNAWPLLGLFLVPLWSALGDGAIRRPRDGFFVGGLFGLAAFVLGFGWLWSLVDSFLDGRWWLGAMLWAGYGAWFAVAFAVQGWFVVAARDRGMPIDVTAALIFVAAEWLQLQTFPVYAGASLIAVPWTASVADLGGPLLLTTLVVGANIVVFRTSRWVRRRAPAPIGPWIVAGLVTAVVAGYGHVRATQIDAAIVRAPRLTVGIVQANLGHLEKSEQSLRSHEQHVQQTRELLATGAVDLVVWPETAYVRGLRRPLPIAGRPIIGDLGVPLVFGGSAVDDVDGQRRTTNAAFLVGADGMIREAYDKNLLIPLAERLPFATLVPGLRGWFPHHEAFMASAAQPALHLGAWRLATPICYEVLRPEFVRRLQAATEAHLLVTLANDGWFGRSQEPWMHLALARLRAVEHRRFLVRATNSGVSAIVDPLGRVVAQTGLLTRENLRGEVRMLEGTTVYGRLGDWPGWGALALLLVVAARRRSLTV